MNKKYDLEIGIDLHKSFSQVALVDAEGRTILQKRFPNSPELLEEFLNSSPCTYRVTFEATRNYFWLVDFLDKKGIPFVVTNPFLNRAIANVHAKSDKYDAAVLANLSRANLIASCFIPPKPVRELRELTRHRAGIIRQQTLLKNKILTSIPGIGLIHAATLIAEIADVSRFPRVEGFVRYAGLSVNTFASAEKVHYGHINKQSNRYIRTALVEASQLLVKKDPGMKAFYEYLKGLKGHGIASIAVARKLARSIYFMLKKGEEYRYRRVQMAWIKPNAADNRRRLFTFGRL